MTLKLIVTVLLYAVLAGQNTFPEPTNFYELGRKNERLGKAGLTEQQKQAIADLVLGKAARECMPAGTTLRQAVDEIRIGRVELTAGEQDFAVQSSDHCNCSPTGNCTFWILRSKENGFSTLLETNMVQSFSIQNTVSYGYKDVITSDHGSATEFGMKLYQFNGTKYVRIRCADERYPVQEDGTISDKSITRSVPCSGRS